MTDAAITAVGRRSSRRHCWSGPAEFADKTGSRSYLLVVADHEPVQIRVDFSSAGRRPQEFNLISEPAEMHSDSMG